MSICFNSSKWFSLDRINGESSIINQFKNQYPPTPVYYSPSNALLWLEVDNYNLTLFATQTTPIVQGSNEITTPGTVGVPVGSVISLGNDPTQYIILQIVGNTITLDLYSGVINNEIIRDTTKPIEVIIINGFLYVYILNNKSFELNE